jgi:hypothetical protein
VFRESKGNTEAKFQEFGAMFTSLPGPIDQVEAYEIVLYHTYPDDYLRRTLARAAFPFPPSGGTV